jgi:ATP-dependent RNA/DNA helicase IGHMBP2
VTGTVDLAAHLARLAALLAAEREEEKARLADAAARLSLSEREERGLALADVEALDEAVLAGRSLVT